MLTGFSIADVGPLGVFLLMVPESACLPVPSEVTLLAAGFAVHQGRMPLVVAIAAATVGNLVGSLIAYAIGRLTARWRLWPWAQKGLRRCDVLLARHGASAVFSARLMPLARTFVSLPAGHARIPITRFTVLTTLGCAIWAAGFVIAGMLLGASWQHASHALRIPLLLLGVAAAVGIVLLTRKRKSSRSGCSNSSRSGRSNSSTSGLSNSSTSGLSKSSESIRRSARSHGGPALRRATRPVAGPRCDAGNALGLRGIGASPRALCLAIRVTDAPFSDRVRGGEVVFGGWMAAPGPATARLLAVGGLDYIVIDLQHGTATEHDLPALTAAIRLAGAAPLGRVRHAHPADIGRALDLGCDGVIVPNVDTAEQAAAVVGACRYPPDGYRSAGGVMGGAALPLCIVMVESRLAMDELPTTLALPGLDGIYVGPRDLSYALGCQLDPNDPVLRPALERIWADCAAAGKPVGVHAAEGTTARIYRENGCRLVTVVADALALSRAGAAELAAARA